MVEVGNSRTASFANYLGFSFAQFAQFTSVSYSVWLSFLRFAQFCSVCSSFSRFRSGLLDSNLAFIDIKKYLFCDRWRVGVKEETRGEGVWLGFLLSIVSKLSETVT